MGETPEIPPKAPEVSGKWLENLESLVPLIQNHAINDIGKECPPESVRQAITTAIARIKSSSAGLSGIVPATLHELKEKVEQYVGKEPLISPQDDPEGTVNKIIRAVLFQFVEAVAANDESTKKYLEGTPPEMMKAQQWKESFAAILVAKIKSAMPGDGYKDKLTQAAIMVGAEIPALVMTKWDNCFPVPYPVEQKKAIVWACEYRAREMINSLTLDNTIINAFMTMVGESADLAFDTQKTKAFLKEQSRKHAWRSGGFGVRGGGH